MEPPTGAFLHFYAVERLSAPRSGRHRFERSNLNPVLYVLLDVPIRVILTHASDLLFSAFKIPFALSRESAQLLVIILLVASSSRFVVTTAFRSIVD
jgi:hypothetical protein